MLQGFHLVFMSLDRLLVVYRAASLKQKTLNENKKSYRRVFYEVRRHSFCMCPIMLVHKILPVRSLYSKKIMSVCRLLAARDSFRYGFFLVRGRAGTHKDRELESVQPSLLHGRTQHLKLYVNRCGQEGWRWLIFTLVYIVQALVLVGIYLGITYCLYFMRGGIRNAKAQRRISFVTGKYINYFHEKPYCLKQSHKTELHVII